MLLQMRTILPRVAVLWLLPLGLSDGQESQCVPCSTVTFHIVDPFGKPRDQLNVALFRRNGHDFSHQFQGLVAHDLQQGSYEYRIVDKYGYFVWSGNVALVSKDQLEIIDVGTPHRGDRLRTLGDSLHGKIVPVPKGEGPLWVSFLPLYGGRVSHAWVNGQGMFELEFHPVGKYTVIVFHGERVLTVKPMLFAGSDDDAPAKPVELTINLPKTPVL